MQPEQNNNAWDDKTGSNNRDGAFDMYQPSDNDEDMKTNNPEVRRVRVPDSSEPVHWASNEYINNEKNNTWFIIFAVVVLAFIALDIFLIKSYTFSILVIVMAIAIIVMSRRPPRQVDYTLSGRQGLYIGEKLYHFNEFKAFSVIEDRGQYSIMLIPIKRLSPGLIFYFPNDVAEEIVDIFGARLPMENRKLDFIDILVQKLRL